MFNDIREALQNTLPEQPVHIQEITKQLPFPIEKSIIAIRYLAEHDEHFLLEDGYIRYIRPIE